MHFTNINRFRNAAVGHAVLDFRSNGPIGAVGNGYVVEVMSCKCQPFTYLKIGQWIWYGSFDKIADWKPKRGELPLRAVKLYGYSTEAGPKVRVTALRGITGHESEDTVADRSVSENKIAIEELRGIGVVPFELRLVRAPQTVAQLPGVDNGTKSLVVSVEPVTSDVPSFKASFLNSSAKPVKALWINLTVDGTTILSGMPRGFEDQVLIEPGEVYERIMKYPLRGQKVSTGEIPEPRSGVRVSVPTVVFADGSYEGDALDAAQLHAFRLGEKIQLARTLELLRSDAAANPSLLAATVDDQSAGIDRVDLNQLTAEFPTLTKDQIEALRSAVQVSATGVQKQLRSTFGKEAKTPATGFELALKAAIARYGKWLNSIP